MEMVGFAFPEVRHSVWHWQEHCAIKSRDDPFSALDKSTEKEVFANVRAMTRDSIVLLLSHRLYLFPQMDQIIWMDEGKTTVGTHEELLQKVSAYATLFTTQEGEDSHEA